MPLVVLTDESGSTGAQWREAGDSITVFKRVMTWCDGRIDRFSAHVPKELFNVVYGRGTR